MSRSTFARQAKATEKRIRIESFKVASRRFVRRAGVKDSIEFTRICKSLFARRTIRLENTVVLATSWMSCYFSPSKESSGSLGEPNTIDKIQLIDFYK